MICQNQVVIYYAPEKVDKSELKRINIIRAIIQVESNGNRFAYNKKEGAAGILQIRDIMLRHVNLISKSNYQLEDRFDSLKSVEMFLKFQEKYNPTMDIEIASRCWNGGNNGMKKIKATENYYQKVLRVFESLN